MASCSHPDDKKQTKMRKNKDGQYEFRTKCGSCGKWLNDWSLT